MLLSEKHPEKILSILLDQQEQILREELEEQQKKLGLILSIKHELKEIEHFSVESIGDIAHIMKQKHELKKLRRMIVLTGIPVTAFQWVAIVLWITSNLWWLFVLWVFLAIPWGIAISLYYFKHINYLCPECHAVFKPRFKEAFFAYHTPKVRRLTCPQCGNKSLCVEVYAEKENNNG